jgi:hypothetical protein
MDCCGEVSLRVPVGWLLRDTETGERLMKCCSETPPPQSRLPITSLLPSAPTYLYVLFLLLIPGLAHFSSHPGHLALFPLPSAQFNSFLHLSSSNTLFYLPSSNTLFHLPSSNTLFYLPSSNTLFYLPSSTDNAALSSHVAESSS